MAAMMEDMDDDVVHALDSDENDNDNEMMVEFKTHFDWLHKSHGVIILGRHCGSEDDLLFFIPDDQKKSVEDPVPFKRLMGLIYSGLIRQMIVTGALSETDKSPIKVPASTAILVEVARYMDLLAENGPPSEISKPLVSKNMHQVCSKWEADFINGIYDRLKIEGLYDIISLAHFLIISTLESLACAKLVSLIKGNDNPEEIKAILTGSA
jgi:hypothetical protein